MKKSFIALFTLVLVSACYDSSNGLKETALDDAVKEGIVREIAAVSDQ